MPDAELPRPALWALTFAFFASGAAGLLFETLWFYQAGLALGNSHWATALVLAAFMSGLAAGNCLAALRPPSARPLATYLKLELLIAGAGCLAVLLFPHLGKLAAPLAGLVLDHPGLVNPIRFILAFATLIVPATAMGMTLPVFTQALASEGGGFGRMLGRLYGVNTLGAVVGVLAGEYLLIGHLGIRGTAAAAAGLNLAAALVAWRLAPRFETASAPSRKPLPWRDLFPQGLGALWLPIGLSGFTLLALEVLWVRFLSLFIYASSRVFALMLAIVLLGIAAGGLAGGALLRRTQKSLRAACLAPFLAGALCALSYGVFRAFEHRMGGNLAESAGQVLWLGLPLMFPVSFLSGVFFTLAGAEIRSRFASSQASAGTLTLVNTAGAILGPLAMGLVFIPKAGMEACFFGMAALYGVVAIAWWAGSKPLRPLAWGGFLAWAASLALFPFGAMRDWYRPIVVARWQNPGENRLVEAREGLTETLMYVEGRQFGARLGIRMVTNAYSMSSNFSGARRYMKQYVYWPLAVHPASKRALLICFGVGCTAKALTDSKQLETIDVVDISRDVLELSRDVFPNAADNPLNDPRVRVHLEDGRYFLQTSNQRFDLITGEPPPPPAAGVVSLYTREYFQLVHDHLNEGGIVTYWLPFAQMGEDASRSIIRSFSEVFGTSFLWHGSGFNLLLVGVRGRLPQATQESFARQWRDPVVEPEMASLGFENPAQFGAGFIGDGDYMREITKDALPLVDDFPKRIISERTDYEPMYRSWIDTGAARERFLRSPAIASLWPASLLQASLPYFDYERTVTTMGAYSAPGGFPDFTEVHRIITRTPLAEPIIWILGSSAEQQRAIAMLQEKERTSIGAQYHLGVKALADRDFPAAAEHFSRTLADPGTRKVSEAAYLYSLCLQGRRQEVSRLIREGGAAMLQRLPPGFLPWLARTFDLAPPA